MEIPLKKVPLDIRRRVAQHLESLRDSDLSDICKKLSIGDIAVPIYRPDKEEVAYYEFHLTPSSKTRKTLTSSGFDAANCKKSGQREKQDTQEHQRAFPKPAGFIIASAGRDDFPISHWSLDRLPPSLQVAQTDTACETETNEESGSSGAVNKLYKLDTLAYVAEDSGGRITGVTGQIPALLSGLPHALEKHAGAIASSEAKPLTAHQDDHAAENSEHEYTRRGESIEVKFEKDGDWENYKTRYADAFGPLLDALRHRASRAWEVEDAISEFGEGIFTGTTHRVALLDEASIDIYGEGAKLIRANIEDNQIGPPTLVLHASDTQVDEETDLMVSLKYPDNDSERLRFFVVSEDTPTNSRVGKPCTCEKEA
ncbi:hypothetical protein ACNKU7_03245 [Microbulbifer sp. SA54]|uniref:hypothetical protein n=1 Tax=Microbulbifer sp. SA54 TaxID=3401577 RepID=UPI003AAD94EE